MRTFGHPPLAWLRAVQDVWQQVQGVIDAGLGVGWRRMQQVLQEQPEQQAETQADSAWLLLLVFWLGPCSSRLPSDQIQVHLEESLVLQGHS